jgi:hypothetical protein
MLINGGFSNDVVMVAGLDDNGAVWCRGGYKFIDDRERRR